MVVEKVQRWATKLICHIRNWLHQEKLKYLDMYSLKRGDLIKTSKILNSFEDVEQDLFFQRLQTNHHLLHVGNMNQRVQFIMDNQILESVTEERDLPRYIGVKWLEGVSKLCESV